MSKPRGFIQLDSKIPDRQNGRFLTCPAIRKFSNGEGLTLIELLAVIAVIALLMAILIPELKQAREEAKCPYLSIEPTPMGRHLPDVHR